MQVVAESAGGLKLKGGAQAPSAGFLGDLRERDLNALDRLQIEWRRHIAGDNDCADIQLAAQIEPAAEEARRYDAIAEAPMDKCFRMLLSSRSRAR